jgi:hypothetical protein
MSNLLLAVEYWLRHCQERGHELQTTGGDASYSYSSYSGRVFCDVDRCGWKAEPIDYEKE